MRRPLPGSWSRSSVRLCGGPRARPPTRPARASEGLGASSPRRRSRRRATAVSTPGLRRRGLVTRTACPTPSSAALVGERHLPGSVLRDEPAHRSRAPTTRSASASRSCRCRQTAPSSPPGGTARSSTLPAAPAGRSLSLHFDGINYRANVWFNGTRARRTRRGGRRLPALRVRRDAPGPAGRGATPSRSKSPPRSPATWRSCGWTGTRRRPTRTWACGTTCT